MSNIEAARFAVGGMRHGRTRVAKPFNNKKWGGVLEFLIPSAHKHF